MASPVLSVEVVHHRTQMRRFADIPFLVLGADPRWNRGVRAYDQWRLDERRHPYFDRGSAAYFLARDAGRPVGRIAAHIERSGVDEGRFGFFDAPDDVDVAVALLDAAQHWLAEQGASSMTGPVSWTPEEAFGVPVEGADLPGVTGREWQPAWYADCLRAADMTPGEQRHWYRFPTVPVATAGAAPGRGDDASMPSHAGRYGDRRLVLDGIAAVPDVTATLASASLRSAWSVARVAKDRQFSTAVVVRVDGDPAVLVPRMAAVAGAAGYGELVAPWGPDGTPVETVHQVFSRSW